MNLRMPLIALCLWTAAESADAGAVFRSTVENFGEDNAFFDSGDSYVSVTKVEGNRMRTDVQSMEGQLATTVLFLGESDEMYMIDHKKRTYMVIDKEQIEALASQMSDAMKQMQEALAQVPPEQREMMERMMKGKMPSSDYKPPSPAVVTDLGQSGSVNGVSCQWKQVSRDDRLERKVCVADPSSIAGAQEMVTLAHEMREFAEGLRQLATSVSNMPMIGGGSISSVSAGMSAELNGFPLIAEDYDGEGKLIRRSTFESADEVAIADGEFAPPSGYKKQSMPKMGR